MSEIYSVGNWQYESTDGTPLTTGPFNTTLGKGRSYVIDYQGDFGHQGEE